MDYGVDMKDKCVIHLENKKEEYLLWPQHMKEFLKQTEKAKSIESYQQMLYNAY